MSDNNEFNSNNSESNQDLVNNDVSNVGNVQIDRSNQKPGKSKKPFVIILGVIIAAIIAVGAFSVMGGGGSDKQKVLNAISNTIAEIDSKNSIYKEMYDKELAEEFANSALHQKGGITLKETSNSELKSIIGFGIGFDSKYNQDDKKMSTDFSVNYKGAKLLNLQTFADEKSAVFSVPEIYNGWFKFETSNLKEQIQNSIFADSFDLNEIPDSINLFENNEGQAEDLANIFDSFSNMNKRFYDANQDLIKEISDNVSIEKAKDKKEITVGEKRSSYEGYEVIIPKEYVNKYYKTAIDFVINDEEFKTAMDLLMVSYSQAGLYDSGEILQEFYNELQQVSNDTDFSDAKVILYLDNKDRVIDYTVSGTITYQEESADYDINVQYIGVNNIADLNTMKMVFKDDVTAINIEYSNKDENQNNVFVNEMNLKMYDETDNFHIGYNMNYDKASGNLNGDAAFDFNGEYIKASLKGNTLSNKETKTVESKFDEINVEVNSGGVIESLSFSGEYSASPLTEEIIVPEGNIKDLFKLSDSEVEEISNNIIMNVYSLMSNFSLI